MSEPTDEALAQAASKGAKTSFDELSRRWKPKLTGFCVLMIGDADEAESLSQEALTRTYQQISDYRVGARFSPWVHGIALNLCRQYLRNRARRATPTDNEALGGVAAAHGRRQGVLSSLYRREINERVMQAMEHLPIALKEAFVMRYIEGRAYDEIAEIAGVSVGTLRARAFRSRLLLQAQLGNLMDTCCLPPDDMKEDV